MGAEVTAILVVLVLAVLGSAVYLARETLGTYFNLTTPTVNKLAEVIERDLVEGQISNKTSRLMYRAGRSDGRHGVVDRAVRFTVVSAVEAAGSILTERYWERSAKVKAEIKKLRVDAGVLEKEAAREREELPTEPGELPGGGFATDGIPSPDQALAQRARKRDLDKRRAGERRVSDLRSQADRAAEEARALETSLDDLADEYQQRWLSTKEIGRFTWNRYVGGYHFGARRDHEVSDRVVPEISFETPAPWTRRGSGEVTA